MLAQVRPAVRRPNYRGGRCCAPPQGHIVTIEDPIEVLHRDQLAIIDQREVGVDTHDFSTALRAVARQDPDVI